MPETTEVDMHILRAVESERTRWWHAMARRDIALCGVALPGEAGPTPDGSLTDLLCPPCMSAIDRGVENAEATASRIEAAAMEQPPAPGPA